MRWILEHDGRTPVPCPNLKAWGLWMKSAAERILAKTVIEEGKVVVVTAFIGVDMDEEPPLLWETKVFCGEHHGDATRYATYEEAEAGHR